MYTYLYMKGPETMFSQVALKKRHSSIVPKSYQTSVCPKSISYCVTCEI